MTTKVSTNRRPIRSNIVRQLAGFLVLGLSSRLHFDECYLDFCELVASQVTTAIATASELVAEPTAMNRLHPPSTRLLREAELHPGVEEVLNATVTLQSAGLRKCSTLGAYFTGPAA
jgi:hypothetical protein